MSDLVVNNLPELGQAANKMAMQGLFEAYRERKSYNTASRHRVDLANFRIFLQDAGSITGDLYQDISAWQGITWGILEGYSKWLLSKGYAVQTINGRIGTVKVYAEMAAKANIISGEALALIRTVKGYSRREAKRVAKPLARVGYKKAVATSLDDTQTENLKQQEDLRNRLMMCLFLDLGLRLGELASLTVESFNLPQGTITFYREKVDRTETHQLFPDSLAAAKEWLPVCEGIVFPAYNNIGKPINRAMCKRSINYVVGVLGAAVGIEGLLSPHDLRHRWATINAWRGLDWLMAAGGWNSYSMPLRYIERGKIANAIQH